jgi:hypothetical protein
VDDRILPTVKKVLGLVEADTSFDVDILMHINTALGTLTQLGIGPAEGFEIEDATATWATFLDNDKAKNPVKSYVVLRVRLLFDPPTTSFAIESYVKQQEELEWRLNVLREDTEWVDPSPVSVPTPWW